MESKIKYTELKKKYTDLPSYNEINVAFHIDELEVGELLLRNIVRRIQERFENYALILSGMLQPDTASVQQMHEFRFFDDAERQKAFGDFKNVMEVYRQAYLVGLDVDEKAYVKFITKAVKAHKQIGEHMKTYLLKMQENWSKDLDLKVELGYLG